MMIGYPDGYTTVANAALLIGYSKNAIRVHVKDGNVRFIKIPVPKGIRGGHPELLLVYLNDVKKVARWRERSLEDRFWDMVDKQGPEIYTGLGSCWLWKGSTVRGYGCLGADVTIRAHVFSFELAQGRKVRSGFIVTHKCDNPPCVNPAHLNEGTHKTNAQERVARKRHKVNFGTGEKHSMARLDWDKVREIRHRRVMGDSIPKLAAAFSVSTSQIWNVVQGIHWRE